MNERVHKIKRAIRHLHDMHCKVHIKGVLAAFLALALISGMAIGPLTSMTSYAYYTRTKSIPSVKITVNTGELEIGDSVTGDAEDYISVSSSNQYYELEYADWLDDVSTLKVGDAPRMVVTLSAIPKEKESDNYSTIYLFTGDYSSSNVTISNGDFITADIRDNGYLLLVTLRINAVKGTFDEPMNVSWDTDTLGEAVWEAGYNDSGYYDLYLYKGGKTLKKLTNYCGNSYDFYPYMTEKGDYQYKVRAVADPEIGVGKSSSYTSSGSLTISASEVSDGSGQTDSDSDGGSSNISGVITDLNGSYLGDSYGFVTIDGGTYFRYPSGELATGWVNLEGTYYRFDTYGKLQTGWYKNSYGKWFYLDYSTGAMQTGWANINDSWYYFKTDGRESQGEMAVGIYEIGGRKYYFDEDGRMTTGWVSVDGAQYYFYPKGEAPDEDGDYGYMAVDTRIGDFTVGSDGAWVR